MRGSPDCRRDPRDRPRSRPVEYFGHEAIAFTKRMVEGQEVYLEYERGSSSKDRYGRTLAYVYFADGTLLNREIISQGYGHAYTRFPFSKMEEFREAQREARAAGHGLSSGEESDEAETTPPRTSSTSEPLAQSQWVPGPECCKICSTGKVCGDSCIRASSTCRKVRACACNCLRCPAESEAP